MDQLTAHSRALEAFSQVPARVGPEQYGGPTPCAEWTVRDLVDHVVGGNNRTAAGHPGKSGDEPGTNGVPEGMDPRQAFAESAQRVQAAFAAPDGLTRTFDLGFAQLPGSAYIGMRTNDVLVHAWDLARATGQPTDLDAEVAQMCLETSRQRLQESFRGPGRPFGAEQPCPPDRPVADQLAAFMGRPVA